MKSIFFEECKSHNVNNLHELKETDGWVNDATRREINWILDTQGDVFGLTEGENGNWHAVEPCDLRDAKNFSVKVIFRESKRDKIASIVQEYNCNRPYKFDMDYMALFIKNIFDMSMYSCIWV